MPGKKRAAKMAERTSMWVDSFLSELSKSLETPDAAGTAVFAPILTKDFYSQAEYLDHIAEELTPSLSGLAFYSSSLLPDIPQTTSLNRLVRLSLDEPSSPHEILRQVSLGMDVFTIPYVSAATDCGLALTYEFPRPSATPDSPGSSADGTSLKPLAINLFSPEYSASVTPLMPSCTCYTCTSHHRAYIQHLLNAKEMLAWTLLAIHNHHATSAFFSAVRRSIANSTFEADKEVFERTYEIELPEATGHKPRARGYHFKSGAAEPRRNKPAWGALSEGVGAATPTPPLIPDEDAVALDDKGFAENLAENPE
jgi:queuine tRNA-ribosyltransferase